MPLLRLHDWYEYWGVSIFFASQFVVFTKPIIICSLIAIMLGRLRMPVNQAKEQYERLGNYIFGSPKTFHYRSLRFARRCKFSATRLAFAVNDVAKKNSGLVNIGLDQIVAFHSDNTGICKT